jgi:lipopolysaccharide export system protein LptC
MNPLSGNWHRIFPLVALGLLAAATFWLERASQVGPGAPLAAGRHDPDLTVEHFTLRRYDLTGTQQYLLTGQRLTHFPDDDSSLVAEPRLVFYGEGRTLHLDADKAQVAAGGERVDLTDHVRARREGNAQHPPMTFESAALTLWPNSERAETRSPLRLTQGGTVIRANSMSADNLFGQLTLAGKVTALLARRAPATDQPPGATP